jgi:flagellar protein FliO/FliZ
LGGELKKASLIIITLLFILFVTDTAICQEAQEIDEEALLLEEADAGPEEQAEEPFNAFTAWDFIRMLLILAAVIGTIYLVFFFLKRSGRNRYQDNELFSVVGSQALNSNKSLHLVNVGNQYFLVGAGENSVSLISEITDKESIDELKLKLSNMSAEQRKSFKDVIFGMLRPAGGQGTQSSFFDSIDFMKKQRERLKRFR